MNINPWKVLGIPDNSNKVIVENAYKYIISHPLTKQERIIADMAYQMAASRSEQTLNVNLNMPKSEAGAAFAKLTDFAIDAAKGYMIGYLIGMGLFMVFGLAFFIYTFSR